jgi:hypothetical protein
MTEDDTGGLLGGGDLWPYERSTVIALEVEGGKERTVRY